MSYAWESIGRFDDKREADAWCERNGIPFGDRQIRAAGSDGEVSLMVRKSAAEPDYNRRRAW